MSRVLSLSVLVVVVVVVVVTAAPPSPFRPPSGPPDLRLKRGNSPPKTALLPYSNPRSVAGVHRPYTSWKHLSSVRRYRYPLYRKRTSPVHYYDYEDEVYLPEDVVRGTEEEVEEEEEEPYMQKPSLFRERNYMQHQLEERKKEEEELMDGYFNDQASLRYPTTMDDLINGIGVYGGDLTLDDLAALSQKSVSPTATGRFYDALSYVRKRATEATDNDKRGDIKSVGGGMYGIRADKDKDTTTTTSLSMETKRRKRNTTTTTTATTPASKRRKTITTTKPTAATTTTTTTTTLPHDPRSKRAFSDYFKWEKRQNEEQGIGDEKEVDDFLTREYFKTIARSVGQKRMAYGQFEPDYEEEKKKRAVGGGGGVTGATLEELLTDPETLRMVQEKLREAE